MVRNFRHKPSYKLAVSEGIAGFKNRAMYAATAALTFSTLWTALNFHPLPLFQGTSPAISPMPQVSCPVSGVNAIQTASTVQTKVGAELVPDYVAAYDLFKKTANRLGITLPPHLNATYLASIAEIESLQGRNVFTPGNSYIGPFGLSPSRMGASSHFAEYKDEIAQMLNTARAAGNGGEFELFNKCKATITPDIIVDANYFHDVRLQGFIVLALGYFAHESMTDYPAYAKAPNEQKVALSYLHYNASAITRFMIDHMHHKGSFAQLVRDKNPKDGKRWLKMMAGNPKAWDGTGRKHPVTIQAIVDHVVEQATVGANLVAQYGASPVVVH